MSDAMIDFGYNVGSDTTLTVISNGVILVSSILTEFEARQKTTELTSKAIDGVNRFRHVEEGWDGTLGYDRSDSGLDDYFAAKESARYLGFQPPAAFITETTIDANTGVPSKYRYVGVTMKMDSAGRRSGDAKVDVRLSWSASRREKVL
jgi:hypothetical protein